MIDNPLLYLLVDRLNVLRHPGMSPDEGDLELQHLDRMMAERGPGDAQWREHALKAYVRLNRADLASVPVRTHHWFVEQLVARGDLTDARPDLFADLYDLLDPAGRFITVRAVARLQKGSGWNPLGPIVSRLAEGNETVRDRRAAEFTDLMLDVWLSEGSPYSKRERSQEEGRPIPEWFVQTMHAALDHSQIRKQVGITLTQRAETLDVRTAQNLNVLAQREP